MMEEKDLNEFKEALERVFDHWEEESSMVTAALLLLKNKVKVNSETVSIDKNVFEMIVTDLKVAKEDNDSLLIALSDMRYIFNEQLLQSL